MQDVALVLRVPVAGALNHKPVADDRPVEEEDDITT